MSVEAGVAGSALVLATAATVVPVDAGTVDSVARLPIVIASLCLVAFVVYLWFRASREQADALRSLTEALKERPCVRDPRND